MSFEKLLQLAQEKFHIGIALAITNRKLLRIRKADFITKTRKFTTNQQKHYKWVQFCCKLEQLLEIDADQIFLFFGFF